MDSIDLSQYINLSQYPPFIPARVSWDSLIEEGYMMAGSGPGEVEVYRLKNGVWTHLYVPAAELAVRLFP